MISKELLSDVLGKEIEDIDFEEAADINEICYYEVGLSDKQNYLNIYELMHLMKEWAYTKGYEIKSFKRIGNFKIKGLYTCAVHNGLRRIWDAEYIEETETEAIFKACEWILDKK